MGLKERIASLVEESIEFIHYNVPEEGYHLAFSGGKDSIVLYDIAKLSGVKFDSHYNITSADPPELVQFIKKYYPQVLMDFPGITMWKLIPKKLFPPMRTIRYCCEALKEGGGEGRLVLIGNKKSDSYSRSKRNRISTCKKKTNLTLSPLYYWEDSDIWQYIKRRSMRYCKLYDEGFTRLGCIGCPMATKSRRLIELSRWPKYKNAYLRSFARMLDARKKRGKPEGDWKTPQDVYDWWIKG